MDPLSVTASIVAIATLAAKTAATFKAPRDVCDLLPSRLRALNNEVVDFEAVCRQVVATLDERASARLDTESDGFIRHLPVQAERTLIETHNVSHRRLRLAAVNAWRRQQARLEQLQGGFQTVKCSLNVLLGDSQSHDLTRIRLDLQTITTVTSQSAHEHADLREELQSHHDSVAQPVFGMYRQVGSCISRMEDMLKDQSERLQAQQESQLIPLYGLSSPQHIRRRSSGTRTLYSDEKPKNAGTETVGFRVTQYASACRPGCPCAFTPLIHSARTDNVNFEMLLLEYKADINAATATGQTPLTTAITLGSHKVLRLLLDRWSEYSTCPRLQGPHLLRTTALFADLETIKILTAADHFKIYYDKSYILMGCLQAFADRYDATEESIVAFRDLLALLGISPSAVKDVDELLESGLLHRSPHYEDQFDDPKVEYSSETDSDAPFEDALDSLEISTSPNDPLIDLS